MKTSIIYLGVFALTVFTTCHANNGLKNKFFSQQEISSLYMGNDQDSNFIISVESQKAFLENASVTEKDSAVFEAIAAYKSTYVKSIEDVIAEDNLITEYIDEELYPLPINNKIVKAITEDNKIIESAIGDEFNPLDFEFINQNAIPNVKVELGIINLDKTDIKY